MRPFVVRLVGGVLNKLGFDLTRVNNYNLSVYRAQVPEERLREKPFFNVGSGDFYHPLWTNIDYVSEWYRSVQRYVVHHDLMSMEPLPIETGFAKIIYTSHTIEHVKEEAVQHLFNEVFRCLEPGGVFSHYDWPRCRDRF